MTDKEYPFHAQAWLSEQIYFVQYLQPTEDELRQILMPLLFPAEDNKSNQSVPYKAATKESKS
jgi:hypothetical protein